MRKATHRLPGLVATDHEFSLPLDHSDPQGAQISVFARELVAPGRESDDLPWLLFLQGGPGHKAFRPLGRDRWLARALQEFRVLLLDQRGTGRSTPANLQTLAHLDPRAQAEYLALHRADAIVCDAERIRRELIGDERWSVLGQSFGGFCATTYLSTAPQGLREAFIMGGLPPLSATAEDVYRCLYPRVLDRNRRYFARYPADAERAGRIIEILSNDEIHLPSGDRLTPRRLQTLGLVFGFSTGFEQVHYLLEETFVPGARRQVLSDNFLQAVEAAVSFRSYPLYALIHEPVYNQQTASRWAAERVRAAFSEFDLDRSQTMNFTGEMIYPWMLEEEHSLRPWREVAHLLAEREDWPALYDPDQLRQNDIPCSAVVYHDDMYVDCQLSLETARAIRGLRPWITNEYEHDGGSSDGDHVLGRLIDLARGER